MLKARRTIEGFLLICVICLIFGYAVTDLSIHILGIAQVPHFLGGSVAVGLGVGMNNWVALRLFFHRFRFPTWTMFLCGSLGAGAGFLGWLIAIHFVI